jgi:hypothetical protein
MWIAWYMYVSTDMSAARYKKNGRIQNAGVQDGGQIEKGWGVRERVAIKPSI